MIPHGQHPPVCHHQTLNNLNVDPGTGGTGTFFYGKETAAGSPGSGILIILRFFIKIPKGRLVFLSSRHVGDERHMPGTAVSYQHPFHVPVDQASIKAPFCSERIRDPA